MSEFELMVHTSQFTKHLAKWVQNCEVVLTWKLQSVIYSSYDKYYSYDKSLPAAFGEILQSEYCTITWTLILSIAIVKRTKLKWEELPETILKIWKKTLSRLVHLSEQQTYNLQSPQKF